MARYLLCINRWNHTKSPFLWKSAPCRIEPLERPLVRVEKAHLFWDVSPHFDRGPSNCGAEKSSDKLMRISWFSNISAIHSPQHVWGNKENIFAFSSLCIFILTIIHCFWKAFLDFQILNFSSPTCPQRLQAPVLGRSGEELSSANKRFLAKETSKFWSHFRCWPS